MRKRGIGGAVIALLTCTTFASAAIRQDPKDPETTLQEIKTWYEAQVKPLREKKITDVTSVFLERDEKIKAALKGMSVEKTEAEAVLQETVKKLGADNPAVKRMQERLKALTPPVPPPPERSRL